MLAGIRSRLTFANVASSLALFIALSGGVAFAVTQLDANSVKSKHIVNGQVKKADISSKALNGSEDWHGVDFDNLSTSCIWSNFGNSQNDAGYFRDRAGVVHLRGVVVTEDGPFLGGCQFNFSHDSHIFHLPPGYRPEHNEALATISNNAPARINVVRDGMLIGSASVRVEPGFPTVANAKEWVSLDGLSFRCGPSGQDGCP